MKEIQNFIFSQNFARISLGNIHVQVWWHEIDKWGFFFHFFFVNILKTKTGNILDYIFTGLKKRKFSKNYFHTLTFKMPIGNPGLE
jgi:hypothetical protein